MAAGASALVQGKTQETGRRLGPCRLVRELGRGGMGVVYLAERDDQEFQQRVAIKRLHRGLETAEILARFQTERQILAHLSHPSIARLFDGGTDGEGRPYFVMELIEGRPIDEHCDSEGLPIRARLELFLEVLGGGPRGPPEPGRAPRPQALQRAGDRRRAGPSCSTSAWRRSSIRSLR